MTKRIFTSIEEVNSAIDRAIATLEAARPRRGRRTIPYTGVGKQLGYVGGQVQGVRDYYSREAMRPKDLIVGPITHLESIFLDASTETGMK